MKREVLTKTLINADFKLTKPFGLWGSQIKLFQHFKDKFRTTAKFDEMYCGINTQFTE